jgi:hypothetical protein
VEAYFDESGTHDGSPIMCVAGYLFSPDQRRRFDQEWLEVLQEFNLPYFRMSECAHAAGAFKGRDDICDSVARRVIGIIKRRAERGMAISISEKDFREHVHERHHKVTGPAYSWCVRWAFSLVADWIEKYNFEGTVSYFFEAGHQHQNIANKIMERLFSSPADGVGQYCCGSHAFASKIPTEACPLVLRPLQAADLLAWQYRHHKIREARGEKTPRLDFASLAECPHVYIDWTPAVIDEQMQRMLAEVYQEELLGQHRGVSGS